MNAECFVLVVDLHFREGLGVLFGMSSERVFELGSCSNGNRRDVLMASVGLFSSALPEQWSSVRLRCAALHPQKILLTVVAACLLVARFLLWLPFHSLSYFAFFIAGTRFLLLFLLFSAD